MQVGHVRGIDIQRVANEWAVDPYDDSAESRVAVQVPANTATSSPKHIEPCVSDDSAESRAVIEPTSGCGVSVLLQRADAAKRALTRADALVSLAQGYLRGDRPNRSPIEITLTIPADSLRADITDPIEVSEMGESFISEQLHGGSAVMRAWSR